jgi:hypothetical protein
MTTIGSIDRALLAEAFPFLAERYSGRRNAIAREALEARERV